MKLIFKMDFKNKVKNNQREKENLKKKSKDKYPNYNTNYLIRNRDKNKSSTCIIKNNKKYSKKNNFENIIKDINNNNINIINYKKFNIQNEDEKFQDYSELSNQLISKDSDTYEDLKKKNKKLREIIIKVSKQLELLSVKYENIKNIADKEKKNLLDKLDKISSNYKLYAESYKENAQLKKEKEILAENNSQIKIIFNSCKNSFVNSLQKIMQFYTKLKLFYENKNIQYKSINYDEFIFSLKEEILNNLMQYKSQLDIINYPNFFYEYNTFIYNEINHYGYKQQNNNNTKANKKARTFKRNYSNEQTKENNSFDEYVKLRKKDKEKERDKSPKIEKNNTTREIILKGKTPSKSNYDFNYNKKCKNFHNTYFHNCFNSKNANGKFKNISNNDTNKSNKSQENLGIFGDVGTIVPVKKRFYSKKINN